jgi:cell division septation protein DedD
MRIERLVVLFAILIATKASAQEPVQRTLLEQAESRLGAGVFEEARDLLAQWRRQNPNAARTNQEQQARYHLLSARLTMNADSAEDQYLTVALNYSTTRSAPEALLRLAQSRFARGDAKQATNYLERLLADFPDSDHRAMGAVWLSRMQPRSAEMCTMLRSVTPGTNPEIIENLKNEVARVCDNAPSNVAATPKPANSTPGLPQPAAATAPPKTAAADKTTAQDRANKPAAATTTTNPGRVAIQVGAFREVSGARSVVRELERAGFSDVRLVRVPGNDLVRVRVGRFENRAAAAATLAKLAAHDISAVLVTDTHAETRVAQ